VRCASRKPSRLAPKKKRIWLLDRNELFAACKNDIHVLRDSKASRLRAGREKGPAETRRKTEDRKWKTTAKAVRTTADVFGNSNRIRRPIGRRHPRQPCKIDGLTLARPRLKAAPFSVRNDATLPSDAGDANYPRGRSCLPLGSGEPDSTANGKGRTTGHQDRTLSRRQTAGAKRVATTTSSHGQAPIQAASRKTGREVAKVTLRKYRKREFVSNHVRDWLAQWRNLW